jgi:hypothetical protein
MNEAPEGIEIATLIRRIRLKKSGSLFDYSGTSSPTKSYVSISASPKHQSPAGTSLRK